MDILKHHVAKMYFWVYPKNVAKVKILLDVAALNTVLLQSHFQYCNNIKQDRYWTGFMTAANH